MSNSRPAEGSPDSASAAVDPVALRSTRKWAIALALLAALWWASAVDLGRTWGWDESMHAELPAARIVLALQAGDFGGASRAVLECQQYPFVYPLVLASVQSFTGISEVACRRVGRMLWALTFLGLWLVLAELELAGAVRANARGWRTHFGSLAIVALCPLGLAYSGTLFLEVPFAAVSAFALRAWLARSRNGDARTERRRDLAAGAWIALAFFTKFNYGLLFAAGLALDFLFDAIGALRRGGAARVARRAIACALVPLASVVWWFVWPLPGDFALAARHREAFLAFLAGNQGGARVAWGLRAIDWAFGIASYPALTLLVVLVGSLAIGSWRARGVRAILCVLAALAIPVALHPFHLDRFLVPICVPLFALFAVGSSRWLASRVAQLAIGVPVLAVALFGSGERVLRITGQWRDEFGAYQLAQLAEKASFSPSRALPTAGLLRSESDALFAILGRELGPTERVGWIGESSEVSPAMFHLGLLANGGSSERFLGDAIRPLDVSFEGVDPSWSRDDLARFASEFDVILASDPPDFAKRPDRAYSAKYRRELAGELGWTERELGSIEIHKGASAPYPVRLFACRPPKK